MSLPIYSSLRLLAAVVPAGAAALAAGAPPAGSSVFELGTLTVFGEAPLAAERVPATVDAATIELLEKRDLAGALALLPGVTLTRFGGRNEAAVNIRGFSRTQTPFFVDGVPVYVPYDGIVDLGRFTTSDVATISVSKGYSSALLGPNTMGGAINLVSRKPSRALEGQVAAGAFDGNGRQANINLGSRHARWYYQLGAAYLAQDYYSLSDAFTPTPLENGGRRENAYRTDWKLSGKVAYVPNATDEYAVGFVRQEGEKGTPPQTTVARFWRWPEWDKQTLYFVSSTRLGRSGYVKPRLYYDTYDNTLQVFDDATYATQARPMSLTTVYRDYTYGGSVEAGARLGERHTLKGVVHYKLDHHREYPDAGRRPTASYINEDESYSYGVEDTLRLSENWELQLGASYDTRESLRAVDTATGRPFPARRFSSFNPQAGLFRRLGEAGALHATVARKSRFPTMKDRYTYRMGMGVPNPDLEPEIARHYEVGYVGRLGPQVSVNAAVYFSRVQDTIQSVFLSPTATVSQFQNIGDSENRGFDLSVAWAAAARATLRASYGYVRQRTFAILPRNTEPVKVTDSPPHSGTWHAELRPARWLSVTPSMEYSSWRYSVADGRGTTRRVGGFTLSHLKVSLRLPRQVSLNAGVENLFDKNYVLQEGYPEAGRTWYGNVRYAF